MFSTDKKVKDTLLQVDQRVILFGTSFLCVDNISLIQLERIPSNKTWKFAVALFLLCISLLENPAVRTTAGIGLFVAVVWIVVVAIYNYNRPYSLNIGMNSGSNFWFYCYSQHFLRQVVDLMVKKINEKSIVEYRIDLKNCTINGGAFNHSILGNNSTLSNGGNSK